jgi:seryl-tRNA synthetase
MLDIKQIRTNPEVYRQYLVPRGCEPDIVDHVLDIDSCRRNLANELQELHGRQNEISGRARTDESARQQVRELSVKINQKEKELHAAEEDLNNALLMMPNMPDPAVPIGADSAANAVVRTWGTAREFTFAPRPHWEIGEQLGILDFKRATKLAGTRFTMSWGAGAMLEWGLMHFMLHLHQEQGYTPVLPPFMVNKATMTASGNLPKFADQLYFCELDGLYLVPTAEVDLVNVYMGEVLDEAQLPIRLTAYTPCFRREAGAGGRDARGLIRVHQFNKVELVKLTTPETSGQELDAMVADASRVLEILELPYRVVLLCTGDMGFSAAKTYDIEVWLPGHGEYREISSCSNCRDFQARRGNVRYRSTVDGKLHFLHGLNGSGVAIGRTVVAILENYQQEDGSVVVPEALRPYLGTDRITSA